MDADSQHTIDIAINASDIATNASDIATNTADIGAIEQELAQGECVGQGGVRQSCIIMKSDEANTSMVSVDSDELTIMSSNGHETNEISMNPNSSVSLTSSNGAGMGQVDVSATSVAVTLQNGGESAHGLTVEAGRTTLSGGTSTTFLVLDDQGAEFSDTAGRPVQIHGVKAGTAPTDAVNVGQLDDLTDEAFRGIAISMAMNIFLPDPGKNFRLNFGTAYYKGEKAFGLTGSGRIAENIGVYVGVGSDTSFEEVGGKAGISLQW